MLDPNVNVPAPAPAPAVGVDGADGVDSANPPVGVDVNPAEGTVPPNAKPVWTGGVAN